MKRKQLLIAGGSGLIGTALQEAALGAGWDVMLLSRKAGKERIAWDPLNGSIDIKEPMEFDAIVNLAGASIASTRWTNKRKKEIIDSRINSSQTLQAYLTKGLLATKVYVGASGIGIYGDRGSDRVDEDTLIPAVDDWMINTVVAWEASHKRIKTLGIRTVILRIGIVLSTKGGALREILRTAPFGILGYFGNGHQIWPWIHVDDLISIIMQALDDPQMRETYLVATPHPVSVKEFTKAVSKQFSFPRLLIPVPGLFLSILLGEMKSILFQSCNAFPSRLIKEGFQFRFPTIEEALKDLIRK